jgi:hypothetical protein
MATVAQAVPAVTAEAQESQGAQAQELVLVAPVQTPRWGWEGTAPAAAVVVGTAAEAAVAQERPMILAEAAVAASDLPERSILWPPMAAWLPLQVEQAPLF